MNKHGNIQCVEMIDCQVTYVAMNYLIICYRTEGFVKTAIVLPEKFIHTQLNPGKEQSN